MLTLDMGGTSADVGILVGGAQRHTTEYEIEWGLPAAVPLIDIKSIGAGGGSIAWVDAGGFLRVGPRSAGAAPGPICYGRGGTAGDGHRREPAARPPQPRVLPRRADAASTRRRSTDAMEALGEPIGLAPLELAASIVEIANENMASAIKMVSLERGHDPRRFSLLAFGGAGPLHAAAVARVARHPEGDRAAVPRRLLGARPAARRHPRRQGVDAGVPLERRRRAAREPAVRADHRARARRAPAGGLRGRAARSGGRSTCATSARTTSTRSRSTAASWTTRRSSARSAASTSCTPTRYGYAIEREVIELVSFKVTVIGKRAPLDLSTRERRGGRSTRSERPGLRPRPGIRRRDRRAPLVARAGRADRRARP